MSNPNSIHIKVAFITAIATIIAALLTTINLGSCSKTSTSKSLILSGQIVDKKTNKPIENADIQIAGKTESAYSETDGNFRVEVSVRDDNSEKTFRIIVRKSGYKDLSKNITLPSEGVICPLEIIDTSNKEKQIITLVSRAVNTAKVKCQSTENNMVFSKSYPPDNFNTGRLDCGEIIFLREKPRLRFVKFSRKQSDTEIYWIDTSKIEIIPN